jgi:hypothetical protein
MRLGVFAKRPRGRPATAAEWDTRRLPPPEARLLFGGIETAEHFVSGLVEGACKQVIGRRLKQTGARWRIRRANRMATLCCTLHGDTWDTYWAHRLN